MAVNADDVGGSRSAEAPEASRTPRVPATATRPSDTPSGKSPAGIQTERLAGLSGDGLAYAPRGTAGNRGFARSKGGFMADCAAGVKKRADAVTMKWKKSIAAERMNSSNDLKRQLTRA